MRIGIFTDAYHPDINGVVTSIKILEKEMKKRGHEVFVFSPSKHEPTENQNLYMLKSMPLFLAKEFDFRLAAFYSRDIAKQIKELNLDIVHTQSEFSLGLFGKIISRKFNIPFIHTYHTKWEEYMHYVTPIKGTRNIYPKRFARTFSKTFMRKAECIISPSKEVEKYLKYKCDIKNKPIYIIPTGIDIEPFNKDNFTEEFKLNLKKSIGINKDDKVILFLGRVGQEKSIDILMNNMPEILNKVDNTKFVLVGDGPALDSLKILSKELNISDKVIFVGRVPLEDVPKYYSIGDVFVNASTSETQGLTYVEAMSAGLPVVAKFAPNLAEFIHNGKNGLLIKNDKDLAKNIIKILTNQTLRNTLIKGGIETSIANSSVVFGDKLIEVYNQTIENYKLKQSDANKQDKINIISNNINNLRKKLSAITKIAKIKKG